MVSLSPPHQSLFLHTGFVHRLCALRSAYIRLHRMAAKPAHSPLRPARSARRGVLHYALDISDSTNAKQANLSWNRQRRIHNLIRALVLRSAGRLYWRDVFGQLLKALVDSGYRTLHPNVGWVGNVGGDLGIVSAARRLFTGREYVAPQ